MITFLIAVMLVVIAVVLIRLDVRSEHQGNLLRGVIARLDCVIETKGDHPENAKALMTLARSTIPAEKKKS